MTQRRALSLLVTGLVLTGCASTETSLGTAPTVPRPTDVPAASAPARAAQSSTSPSAPPGETFYPPPPPTPPTPSATFVPPEPVPGARSCVPADLTSAAVGDGSWMGHTVTYVQLQNRGPVCTLTGYAEVRGFNAAGRRIPITVQHQTQVTPSRSIRVEQVTLPSHGAAQFVITLTNRIHGDCSPQHGGRVAVLLPSANDSAEPVASWRMDVCDRAAIAVTPFFAAAYIPPRE